MPPHPLILTFHAVGVLSAAHIRVSHHAEHGSATLLEAAHHRVFGDIRSEQISTLVCHLVHWSVSLPNVSGRVSPRLFPIRNSSYWFTQLHRDGMVEEHYRILPILPVGWYVYPRDGCPPVSFQHSGHEADLTAMTT